MSASLVVLVELRVVSVCDSEWPYVHSMDPALISVAFGNSVGIAVSFSLRFLEGKPFLVPAVEMSHS